MMCIYRDCASIQFTFQVKVTVQFFHNAIQFFFLSIYCLGMHAPQVVLNYIIYGRRRSEKMMKEKVQEEKRTKLL